MGTFKTLKPVAGICEALKPCWDIVIATPEEIEDEYSFTSNKTIVEGACWEVSAVGVEERWCWQVSATCAKQNPEPFFPTDMDMKEHDISKLFAVHISHNYIYLAVEMRPPDNEELQIWTDDWGSAVTQQADGKWVYKPKYKATEIVSVYDGFGSLDHTIQTDSNGYKYITMDEMDIVFSVDYKIDHGFRIIKGKIGVDFTYGYTYMDYIELSHQMSPELVGEGCILMQHRDAETSDPLIFRAKNSMAYMIDVSDLQETILATANINYMLNVEYAMNSNSSSRFNVVTNTGEADAYPTETTGIYNCTMHNVMQNDKQTIAFPIYLSPKEEKQRQFQHLRYLFFDLISYGGTWSGSGALGSVLGNEVYQENLYAYKDIPYIPTLPPVMNDYDLIGMTPDKFWVYTGYEFPYNQSLSESMIRINAIDDFIVSTGSKIIYLQTFENTSYPNASMTGHDVCDVTGSEDFCFWDGVIAVADGTGILKVHNVKMYSDLY